MHPLLQLIRFDKPIGTWLLAFPALWALALAAHDITQFLTLSAVMLLGAFITRSGGCIINDLTDQRLDAGVARTRSRPLASGTVSRRSALLLLVLVSASALAIALALPRTVFYIALCAVPLIVAYPWMKRIIWWPQIVLGLTFNLSALMGWAATGAALTLPAFLIYAAGAFWTLGYDTIYAVQDMADDETMGIKSSARTLGIGSIRRFVTFCYSAVLFLILVVCINTGYGYLFLIGWVGISAHVHWQICKLPPTPQTAGPLFKSNQWLGLIILLTLLLSRFG